MKQRNHPRLEIKNLSGDASDGVDFFQGVISDVSRFGVCAKVVGPCVLIRLSPSIFEVAKLTVSREMQGKGLGRRLTYFAIDRARVLGAVRVGLLSNTNWRRLYDFTNLLASNENHYQRISNI